MLNLQQRSCLPQKNINLGPEIIFCRHNNSFEVCRNQKKWKLRRPKRSNRACGQSSSSRKQSATRFFVSTPTTLLSAKISPSTTFLTFPTANSSLERISMSPRKRKTRKKTAPPVPRRTEPKTTAIPIPPPQAAPAIQTPSSPGNYQFLWVFYSSCFFVFFFNLYKIKNIIKFISNNFFFSFYFGETKGIILRLGLFLKADDVADLEWVSHFVDDSLPELSLLYPVPPEQTRVWAEPKPRPGRAQNGSAIPRRPRTGKSRKPNARVWSFTVSPPSLCFSVLAGSVEFGEPTAKKQKKKAEAQSGAQFQRRCSHCQVQKTPQWRTGPLGPKTLCNACGVRFKSGRLFPEYRPACSPTFSGDIHSNSHRKVLEMRRRKETSEPQTGSDRTQLVPSCWILHTKLGYNLLGVLNVFSYQNWNFQGRNLILNEQQHFY